MSASAADKKDFTAGVQQRAAEIAGWTASQWAAVQKVKGQEEASKLQDEFDQGLDELNSAVGVNAGFEKAVQLDKVMSGLSAARRAALRMPEAASAEEAGKEAQAAAEEKAEPPSAAAGGKGKRAATEELEQEKVPDSPSQNTRASGKSSVKGEGSGGSKRKTDELPRVGKVQKKLSLVKDVTVEIDDDDDTGELATSTVSKEKQSGSDRTGSEASKREAAKVQKCVEQLAMLAAAGGSRSFLFATGAPTLAALVNAVAVSFAGKTAEEKLLLSQAFFSVLARIEQAFPREMLPSLTSLEQLEKVWKTWLEFQTAKAASAELIAFGGETGTSKEETEEAKQASLTARLKAALKAAKPSPAENASNKGDGGKSDEQKSCANCGAVGHFSRNCPKPKRFGDRGGKKESGWKGSKTKFDD